MQIFQTNVSPFVKFLVDSDIENAPRLSFTLNLNNSLISLDDLKEAIAIKLDMWFVYDRFQIKALKRSLLGQPLDPSNEDRNSHDCKLIRFNITKWNPFFCKYEDLGKLIKWEKIQRREIIKPFAICYTSKTKLERYSSDSFRYNFDTAITIDQVAVKMSINQIVSFYSMIQNTSNILTEKYTEKIKKDIISGDEKNMVNNSEPKKSLFTKPEIFEGTEMFKETFEVFSNRYNQVPGKKVVDQTDVEDDEEEKALSSKHDNLMKVNSKITMVNSHSKI